MQRHVSTSYSSEVRQKITLEAHRYCGTSGVVADNVEMVKQYRKLDDQIITRLNRAQAQFRDQSRAGSSSKSGGPDTMCYNLWHEMMCKLTYSDPIVTQADLA